MTGNADNEAARLRALYAYEILDTPAEPAFDQITALAASLFDTGMASIGLMDHDRIWFKSRVGIEAAEFPRNVVMNGTLTDFTQPTVVEDAAATPAAIGSPMVRFGMRFYVGVPLTMKDGHTLGMLCVWDTKPHTVTPLHLEQMTRLATIAVSTIEQRQANSQAILLLSSLVREKDAALARASGATKQMRHAAQHDQLTGLANRAAFEARLWQRMRSERHAPFSLLFFDVDHLQLVNDMHGHPVGDHLLGRIAERLREIVARTDLVARLGGDEFAVIHEGAATADESAVFANALVEQLALPYDIADASVRATVSIGIARYPDDSPDTQGMMRSADRALFCAKRGGRNGFRLFDHADEMFQQERFALERDLRVALSTGQLRLMFQPIYSITAGRIVGAEALARWDHPDHGEISPDVFITLAEQTGQIQTLGLWALQVACREAASWPRPVQVSVNCSPLQFMSAELPQQINIILGSSDLPPERLDVEVTERMFLDDTDRVLDSMGSLRKLGVHLTLDDFGAGHAGLSYVRKFKFDRIKIDKSFVHDLNTAATRAIVETMLQMGSRLGVETVAEGVESVAQRDWLAQRGCVMAQGHLYSRPLSSGAFAAKLLNEAA